MRLLTGACFCCLRLLHHRHAAASSLSRCCSSPALRARCSSPPCNRSAMPTFPPPLVSRANSLSVTAQQLTQSLGVGLVALVVHLSTVSARPHRHPGRRCGARILRDRPAGGELGFHLLPAAGRRRLRADRRGNAHVFCFGRAIITAVESASVNPMIRKMPATPVAAATSPTENGNHQLAGAIAHDAQRVGGAARLRRREIEQRRNGRGDGDAERKARDRHHHQQQPPPAAARRSRHRRARWPARSKASACGGPSIHAAARTKIATTPRKSRAPPGDSRPPRPSSLRSAPRNGR